MIWISAAPGDLESALPGEWAALVLTLASTAVPAAVILAVTCLRHERVVARRARALSRTRDWTPPGGAPRDRRTSR